LLDLIGGLKVAGVAFAEAVVFDPFLRREAEGFGAEIVFTGILAGDGFADNGARTGSSVGRIGGGRLDGGHDGKTPSQKKKAGATPGWRQERNDALTNESVAGGFGVNYVSC
jgi:hypothetical protein